MQETVVGQIPEFCKYHDSRKKFTALVITIKSVCVCVCVCACV